MATLDDLLIRRRRKTLTALDARRLESALRASREYELALLAQDVFERDGAAQAGDASRVRELVAAIERGLPSPPRPARPWWRLGPRVAVPLLLAGAAAASVGIGVRRGGDAVGTPVSRPSARPLPSPRPQPALDALEPERPREAPQPPMIEPPARRRAPLPSVEPPRPHAAPPETSQQRAATTAAQAPSSAPASEESARAMFRRANGLRHGDWPAAAVVYGELIRRHPSSNEASVSELALGKWSLSQGRSGDALDWFRAYLRRGPGALTAEALFGEARALESIGSIAAARAPWRRLLEEYPASPYAALARQRLEP